MAVTPNVSSDHTRVILSIHDVMPESMDRVEAILAFCAAQGIPPMTLLVVPGRLWQAAQLRRLRSLADQGYTLAAHGWSHRIERFGGIHHRLHAALISRHAGEHLALTGEGVVDLMHRAHGWFADNELPPPDLYVPPAWALGRLPAQAARELPYTRIEVLRGVLAPASGQVEALPLVGFEADTWVRAQWLRGWNRWQLALGRRTGRPVRIGIHPEDFELRLGEALRALLQRPFRFVDYSATLAPTTMPNPTQ
ncbi:MAG TPA: polysaccharide deacetylase family protein [Thioalkalivibrio sp.]|nr:polysaccharide deacetylase family protein [Thioalkalivibrio sp.]